MLEAGDRPLADQRALELADGRQDLQREPTLRCRGVDRVPERPETDAAAIEVLDGLQQVQHRARQAVELGHHQHVARPGRGERLRQLRTVPVAAGRVFA